MAKRSGRGHYKHQKRNAKGRFTKKHHKGHARKKKSRR